MRCLFLAALTVVLLAPALHAQSLLDAGRDTLTGEPLVLSPSNPPSGAVPGSSGFGGDLVATQHLGAGATKLVRSVGDPTVGDLTVYQDGIDLVVGWFAFPVRGPFPTLVFLESSRYRLPAQPSDAVAVGNRLYVALRKNEGVLMLDLQPTNGTLSFVGQISGLDALAVAVSGTTVYVARGAGGVVAYDVTLPSIPVPLGTVDTPGSANGLAIEGTLLAVADGNVSAGPDVRLYDVSTAGAFAPLGTAEADGFATYAAFYEGRLYVTGAAGLLAFDVSNPAAPMRVGSTPAGGETTYEVVFDSTLDRAYVAGLAGLRIVDVSAPAPVEVASYNPGGQGLSVALTFGDGFVGLADRFNGLRVVNPSASPAPAEGLLVRNGGFAHKATFADGSLFVTDLAGGLRVFDTSGATAVETGRVDLPANTQEVLVVGSLAYVTDADGDASGLSVVDVSDAASPLLVGTYPLGASYGMATDASGETLFVANGFAGLASVDLRGAAPTVLTTFPTGANTVDVAVDNAAGIAYIVTLGGGMVSAYVADPTTLTPLDSEPGFGFLQAIALDPFFSGGQRAFVADGANGLRLVDVTNGAVLESVSTTPTASPPRDVAVRDVAGFDPLYSNVYVAEDFSGLRRFQVSAYSNTPVEVTGAFASADRGLGVAVEPGLPDADVTRRVALAAGEVGVYLFADGMPTAATPALVPGRLAIETVAPNPVAGRATVRYRLAAAGTATVEVLDLLGRRVATLAAGPHAAGAHTAALEAGALPAGLYVVRVTQDGASATARLAVVR